MSRMLIAASWMLIALGLCSCAKEDGPDAGAKPKTATDPTPQEVLADVANFYETVKSVEVTGDRKMNVELNGRNNESGSQLQLSAERPNRLFVQNSSGQRVSTVVCDGTTLYASVGALNRYSESPAVGEFSEFPQNRSFLLAVGSVVPLPLRLLSDDPVRGLMEGVTASTYIGRESINGNPAHHLKFQLKSMMDSFEADWELWVQADGDPLILQFRQTTARNQGMKMRNSVTETFRDWKFDESIAANKFAFTPPPGAERVEDLYASALGDRNPQKPEPEPIPSSGNPVIDFFRSVDRGVKSTTPQSNKPSPAKPDDARNPFDNQ